MANRSIRVDKKVAAMQECLTLKNVKAVMENYGFSERSAWSWYSRILDGLPELLANQRPGPKPKPSEATPFLPEE